MNEKYYALLNSPSAKDHFRALELMQSEQRWSLEEALTFSVSHYISKIKTTQYNDETWDIYFGDVLIQIRIKYCINILDDTFDIHHYFKAFKGSRELFYYDVVSYRDIDHHTVIEMKNIQDTTFQEFHSLLPMLLEHL